MVHFKIYGWVVALLTSILLAACTPSETSQTTTPSGETSKQQEPEGRPKRGGTLTTTGASRSHADPAMGQIPSFPWYYSGDPMLRRNAKTFELEPGVFESWEVSRDGMEVTLKVRKGMKFHNKPPVNGREVEARDLVYVLKSATGQQYPDLSPVRFPRRESFGVMKDAVAVDKYTVKVTLESPSVSFLHALADYRGTWVYPEGLREAFGGLDSLQVPSPERHIGSGPFILTKFVSDVEATVERNPEYWDKDQYGNQLPYLDKIYFRNLPDVATQQAAFVAGQIDLLSTREAQNRNFVVKNHPKANIVTFEPDSCWFRVSLNTQRKPFDDYRVRRALYLVMDKKQIGEVITGEWEGKPLWKWPGPIPFVFPESRPQDELAKHKLYQGPTPENVAEARKLLAEAGYENGFTFEWHLTKSYIDEAQIIQQNWTKHLPGVSPTLKPVDAETHRALAARGEYEAQLYCHIFDVTAVAHLAQAYHTTGGRNYGRYSDPKLDVILDEAERTLELEPRKKLLRQAEDYILDHSLAMLPTRQYLGQEASQPDLRGIVYGPGTSSRLSVARWWRDK